MRIQPTLSPLPLPADSQEAKVREAAMDFEALLIAQLLHAFRGESTYAGSSNESTSSSSTMLEYAEQHLAQVMSRQGGLGLHELIVRGLLPPEDSAAQAQPAGQETVAQTGRSL